MQKVTTCPQGPHNAWLRRAARTPSCVFRNKEEQEEEPEQDARTWRPTGEAQRPLGPQCRPGDRCFRILHCYPCHQTRRACVSSSPGNGSSLRLLFFFFSSSCVLSVCHIAYGTCLPLCSKSFIRIYITGYLASRFRSTR